MGEAPTQSADTGSISASRTDESSGLVVSATTGTKCVRCWHIRDDIGVDSAHPELRVA